MQALPCWAGMQVCNITYLRRYSSQALTACPAFILKTGYPNDLPSTYRYGQYFVANVFWNVTPNMQVGAEYLRGWRTNFDNSTNHANRMNLLVQYSF